jgi:hypothetical protein
VPLAHSAVDWQVRLQVPPEHAPVRQVVGLVHEAPLSSPQMPSAAQTLERHWVAEVQGPPLGSPHSPSAPQRPSRQPALVVQEVPVAPPHFPSESQTLERQSVLVAQVSPLGFPHLPSVLQTPERQLSAWPQGLPLLAPQRWSLSQTPDWHWLSLPQAPPLGATGRQSWVDGSQNRPAAQSVLVAQVAAQVLVASQMPERQSEAPAHGFPVGAPHWPSVSHTPEAHWVLEVHGVPLGFRATQVPLPQ